MDDARFTFSLYFNKRDLFTLQDGKTLFEAKFKKVYLYWERKSYIPLAQVVIDEFGANLDTIKLFKNRIKSQIRKCVFEVEDLPLLKRSKRGNGRDLLKKSLNQRVSRYYDKILEAIAQLVCKIDSSSLTPATNSHITLGSEDNDSTSEYLETSSEVIESEQDSDSDSISTVSKENFPRKSRRSSVQTAVEADGNCSLFELFYPRTNDSSDENIMDDSSTSDNNSESSFRVDRNEDADTNSYISDEREEHDEEGSTHTACNSNSCNGCEDNSDSGGGQDSLDEEGNNPRMKPFYLYFNPSSFDERNSSG